MQQKAGAEAAAAAASSSSTTALTEAALHRLQEDHKLSALTTAAATTTATTNATTGTGSGSGSGSNDLIRQLLEDMRQIENTVDSIEIPARGRCRVYMAKYCYDPFKQSPNDNPDAELAFNAGDYIMVFDFLDEDGYFIGELMDGRRGYVPSNWLDRLTGEDLFDFQANVLYKQAGVNQWPAGSGGGVGGDNQLNASGGGQLTSGATAVGTTTTAAGGGGMNASTLINATSLLLDDDALDNGTYPPEFYDALIADTMAHSNFQHLLAPEDYHRMNDYVDLDDVNEVDDECLSDYERAEAEQMRRAVPPPQRLLLERQLNKCILIAWLHPQSAKGTIVSYQVYVDGVLKSTVPSGDRTKALLEGVDSSIPHRISVRAIDVNGRHSNDAGCTIVIGQDVPFAPSCVKASHITSDSALISWLPCNSNFHHVVAVNSVEVQTVRPGVYKHLINGLSANTLYRVWVRAKPGKILSIDEKNFKKLESLTTYVDFKTMPKSLPDPPVNVQVEAGPQRRTLLVTWLPLTLNDFGVSNGCAVTGYAVFAGHKKLADIDSPTGDHALLDICDLESLHKKSVTVRTKSGENLSQDSMPCHIPDEYLKVAHLKQHDQQHGGGVGGTSNHHHYNHRHNQQQHATSSSITAAGGQRASYGHSYGQQQQGHHQQSSSSGISHSPSRQRMMAANRAGADLQQRIAGGGRYHQAAPGHPIGRASRQVGMSLQNLESDLDSRRSSIPAIEITRETSGSELLANQAESYSEEEFESSMRFRGSSHNRAKAASAARIGSAGGGGGGGVRQFRARQSHSVDGSSPHGHHQRGQQQHQMSAQRQMALMNANRQYQSQANLVGQQQQRLRGATPMGETIRHFISLFDYDPLTMSPNPNAVNEELAFKEGSIIKVYGGLGDDGFYKGEFDNKVGFVPCNVITEITDPGILASLYSENSQQLQPLTDQQQRLAAMTLQQQQQQQPMMNSLVQSQQQLQQQQQQEQQLPPLQAIGGAGAVKRMVALYDYDPQENSPNADTESEIPFRTGDIIYVCGKMDADGFYMGEVERTKQRGLVPSNFLREEPLQLGMKQQQQPQFQNNPGAMQLNQQQLRPNQFQQLDGQLSAAQQVQLQMQQQQQLRAGNAIRGQPQDHQMQNPLSSQSNIQQQPQQQNINRPNSLSLINNQQQQQQLSAMNMQNQQMAMKGMLNGPASGLQPQQQQQPQQNQNPQQLLQQLQQANPGMQMTMNPGMVGQLGAGQFIQGTGANASGAMMARVAGGVGTAVGGGVGGQQLMGNQQQLRGQMINPQLQQQQQQQPQQMFANQQQQQQQQQPVSSGAGGVLSNLLSSGKQIIGAATTPRMPNQPGPYPSLVGGVANQMGGGGGGGVMNANNSMAGVGMQQNVNSIVPGGQALDQMGANRMGGNLQQQQQPAQDQSGGPNSAFNQTGNISGGDLLQQQQQHGNPTFAMGSGVGGMVGNQQQAQQQYNQGPSFGRPTGVGGGTASMNHMGEEQGGNILNTVKNMFKL